jgi:hypothetical protein
MQRFGEARGAPLPDWLTEPFIAAVLERTRQLTGRWRATPYGGSMELPWPAADEPTTKKRTLKGSF